MTNHAKRTPGRLVFRTHHGTDEEQAKYRELGIDPAHDMTNDGSRSLRIDSPDTPTVAHVLCRTQPKRGQAYGHQDPERDANAQFIADAWNACTEAGITDPAAISRAVKALEAFTTIGFYPETLIEARAALRALKGEA